MTVPASSDPLPAPDRRIAPEQAEKKEVLFHGFPASPGICRGRALVFGSAHTDFNEIEPIPIEPSQVESEIAHFQAAIEKTKSEIKSIQNRQRYSSVRLTMSEAAAPAPDEPDKPLTERMGDAFRAACDRFAAFFEERWGTAR